MSYPQSFNLSTLANGMRVVTHCLPTSPKTSIRASIDCGSRDEAELFPRGLSHAIEHSVFLGSNYYQTHEAQSTIQNVGGALGALTDFDCVDYYATVPSCEAHLGFHVIGDMISHPRFPRRPVRHELEVIDNEWLETQLNPDKVHAIRAFATSSGEHPNVYPVLGDRRSIASITPKKMAQFHQKHYLSGNTIVAAEGHVDHDEVVSWVNKWFSLPTGFRTPKPSPRYVGGDLRWEESLPGTRVTLAFCMPPRSDFQAYAPNRMLGNILDSMDKGSLYHSMRVKRRLVYAVSSFRETYSDYTLLFLKFNCFSHKVRGNLETIASTIKNLTSHVDTNLLANLKRSERLDYSMGLLDPTYGVGSLIDDIRTHGRPLPTDFYINLLENVSQAEVKLAASALLQRKPTFIASGDLRHLPAAEEIQDLFSAPRQTKNSKSTQRKPKDRAPL